MKNQVEADHVPLFSWQTQVCKASFVYGSSKRPRSTSGKTPRRCPKDGLNKEFEAGIFQKLIERMSFSRFSPRRITHGAIVSLKSMTAFGSGESTSPSTTYRCEIRTLNSRFCDISIKMPRSLIALEPALINQVKEKILRGKVDVLLELVPTDRSVGLPKLNAKAVTHLLAASHAV